MITYVPAGRLGNAMFQCAMTIQYALKHGIDFHIPSETDNRKWNPIYFPHLQNPNFNPRLPKVYLREQTHAYHEVPFEESWRTKNIYLSGYWQSHKFFDWCRDELLKALDLPWKLNRQVVSVHVRRGDYLLYPEKHPPISIEYYLDAMGKFPDNYIFLFFSDDIPWCKKTFGESRNCTFSEGQNEMRDLIDMSCCEHFINSSSTFSWWGAWLNQNPNKIVITPKLWFVPGHNNLSVKDIIPDTWIKM